MMSQPRPVVIGDRILPGGEQHGPGTWTPWLLIRFAANDAGARPIANGTVFWLSPDIAVDSSDPWGNAVAGEENFVEARIFNLGKAPAIPTKVDFYWGDPSLGLGPGKMNYIGTEWAALEPHRGTIVRCTTPWIPEFRNNGHECLMVQCVCPVLEDLSGPSIAPPAPLQPQVDRHVGQHNITVLPAKVGVMHRLGLDVYNPFPLAMQTLVTMRVQHLVFVRDPQRTVHRRALVDAVVGFDPRATVKSPIVQDVRTVYGSRGGPEISTRLAERGSIVPTDGARTYLGRMLLAADGEPPEACVDTRGHLALHDGTFRAFENRRLEVELRAPAGAQPGEVVVVHLFQTSADLPVGGYTIVMPVIGEHGWA